MDTIPELSRLRMMPYQESGKLSLTENEAAALEDVLRFPIGRRTLRPALAKIFSRRNHSRWCFAIRVQA